MIAGRKCRGSEVENREVFSAARIRNLHRFGHGLSIQVEMDDSSAALRRNACSEGVVALLRDVHRIIRERLRRQVMEVVAARKDVGLLVRRDLPNRRAFLWTQNG